MTIGNRTLQFMFVPNLHWPDTMYTFIEEEQILVTCDSFGSHYCLPEVVSSEIKNEDDYQEGAEILLRLHHRAVQAVYAQSPGPGGADGHFHGLHGDTGRCWWATGSDP